MIVAACPADVPPPETPGLSPGLPATSPIPSNSAGPVNLGPVKLAGVDDDLDEEGDEPVVGDAPEAAPGFGDDLDDEVDDFDDIDEDDFDDDFDDDFEEELEDDYEIEIDDEISAEFGLGSSDDDEEIEEELDDFEDFDEI